jgi:hypothetical protein
VFTVMIAFLFAFVLMALALQPFAPRGRPLFKLLGFCQKVEKTPVLQVSIKEHFRVRSALSTLMQAFRGIVFATAGGTSGHSAPCLG